MNLRKRLAAAAAAGIMFLAAALPVSADGIVEEAVHAGTVPELPVKSAALFEVSTGKLLYEENCHEKMSPASITKIMTMLLLMENVSAGKIALTDTVTASDHACSMGGSQIWLEPGETMTVDELLRATAIGSANDASVALAEHMAGSEEAFVNLMNEKAKALGMNDTQFKNASGLDEEGHYSSAYDIGLMSMALLRHEKIKEYSTVWMDSLRDGKTALVNTNRLVRFYEGCTGLKTGTTDDAGCCLSASAMKSDMELVAVVLGAANSNDRFDAGRSLLDHGFANYSVYTPIVDTKQISAVRVKAGVASSVEVNVPQLSPVVIPKGKEESILQNIELEKSLKAPVKAGQTVGRVSFLLDGETVAQVQLTAASSVSKMTFGNALKMLIKNLLSLSSQ